jgi:hypothetical protein
VSAAGILAAVVAALEALARALGLAADRRQRDAGAAEQAAADLEAGDVVEDKAVAAGDAYDRLSDADRGRLRESRGDYRD